MKSRALKILLLNLGIALVDVIMFSKGLVGLDFAGGAITTALAVTVIAMSLIAFGYGNYTLLFSEPAAQPLPLLKGNETMQPRDYIDALEERRGKGVFEEEIRVAIEQIYRLLDKDRALDNILEQYFTPQEMTYTRFQNGIDSVQALFYNNVKKMINRLLIFDYKDYRNLTDKIRESQTYGSTGIISKSVDTQMKIYSEHIEYVRGLCETNENILIKLDGLLLEISKLDDLDEQGMENIAAIQEINALIEQTKFYKN